MTTVDIDVLVRDALLHIGCDAGVIGEFDGHSTIALEFHWSPTIYVSVSGRGNGREIESESDGDIYLWCRLSEHCESMVDSCSLALFTEQMKKIPYIRGDHVGLDNNQGNLELKALIDPYYLQSAQLFSEVLEGFLERADTFREIVK
ncbi:InvB/SpaK family type III secretion system chaperone [Glaciimonas sp. GG7]